MANFQEVAALKKELDDLQRDAEGRRTPATPASTAAGDDGTIPGDISLGPSANTSPALGAADRSLESIASNASKSPLSHDIPELQLDGKQSGQQRRNSGSQGSDSSAVVVDNDDSNKQS